MTDGAQEEGLESGSFRDPYGRVSYRNGEVLREFTEPGWESWKALRKTRFFERFTREGYLIGTREHQDNLHTLVHDRIPWVSYPYEWPFGMLKRAALLHLDLLASALDEGFVMTDSSSYNIQWIGTQPVFIDIPSFQPMRGSELWHGYRQFCEQFLYPLMLQAHKDVAFQPWLRGCSTGIRIDDLGGIFSWQDVFRPGVFLDVLAHRRAHRAFETTPPPQSKELMIAGLEARMIQRNISRLMKLIQNLVPRGRRSRWISYLPDSRTDSAAYQQKKAFIASVLEANRRGMVWDLGTHAGEIALMAARSADQVVAVDAEPALMDGLYARLGAADCRNVLPLIVDLSDPSPGQGWLGVERKPFFSRGRPELVIAVGLLHHLAIRNRIPLEQMVGWLASLQCEVILEFIGPDDLAVREYSRGMEGSIPADYDQSTFDRMLATRFHVTRRERLGGFDRTLYLLIPAQSSSGGTRPSGNP